MRTLIRTSWIVIISMILTGSVLGQPGGGGRGGRGSNDGPPKPTIPDSAQIVEQVDELAAELSLTEDQKEAVLELHQEHFADVEESLSNTDGDRDSHREQMDALRKEFQEDMKELLSDEQYEKFEESMKTHDPRSGPPKKRGN